MKEIEAGRVKPKSLDQMLDELGGNTYFNF